MSITTARKFVEYLEKYENNPDMIEWAKEYILKRYLK